MGSLAYDHVQNHTTGSFRPGTIPSVAATSSASNFDSDAEVFFTAAGITDATQKSAVNTLVLGLKSNSIWTKMLALYPFVGGSASAHAVNLKTPGTYNITWNGGITHSASGVQGNGTTGYGNTGITPFSHLTLDNTHISVYSRTNSTVAEVEIGTFDGTVLLGMFCKYTDGKAYGYQNEPNGTGAAQVAAASNTSSAAFYTLSRVNSSASGSSIYRNAVVGATTGSNNVGYTHPNSTLMVLARGNPGAPSLFSNRQVALISVGSGLTSTDASNLYTLVQSYQTTLGRQV